VDCTVCTIERFEMKKKCLDNTILGLNREDFAKEDYFEAGIYYQRILEEVKDKIKDQSLYLELLEEAKFQDRYAYRNILELKEYIKSNVREKYFNPLLMKPSRASVFLHILNEVDQEVRTQGTKNQLIKEIQKLRAFYHNPDFTDSTSFFSLNTRILTLAVKDLSLILQSQAYYFDNFFNFNSKPGFYTVYNEDVQKVLFKIEILTKLILKYLIKKYSVRKIELTLNHLKGLEFPKNNIFIFNSFEELFSINIPQDRAVARYAETFGPHGLISLEDIVSFLDETELNSDLPIEWQLDAYLSYSFDN